MAGKKVKIVVVGDGFVGKTSLLVSYKTNTFPLDYIPTVFDNFCQEVTVDGQRVNLQLWDTAGQEGFDRLRCLAYPNTDLFMLCFAIDRPSTLKHIQDTWFPEIQSYQEHVPVVLVGTKLDLRDKERKESETDETEPLVTFREGRDVAGAIRAKCYFECSAWTQTNLHDTFLEAIRVVLDPRYTATARPRPRRKCIVL